jgi:beta-1,4-mannosyl-glycoprotein beta-1,4-N-acetylglucosaminyltransferase
MKNLYDFFIFSNEKKMLNFRFHELNEVVDKFIIVESDKTFTGVHKGLNFNIDDYSKFKDKIIYKPFIADFSSYAWTNEYQQRRYLKSGYDDLPIGNDDLIVLSDVDEIPDPLVLNRFKNENFKGIRTFYHDLYYNNFRTKKIHKWSGSLVIDNETFIKNYNCDFESLRGNRDNIEKIGVEKREGGWHLSYFGDVDFIINKIKSFSHQEFNTPEHTDPEKIMKCINEGKDLLQRSDNDTIVLDTLDPYLPKHINLLD